MVTIVLGVGKVESEAQPTLEPLRSVAWHHTWCEIASIGVARAPVEGHGAGKVAGG